MWLSKKLAQAGGRRRAAGVAEVTSAAADRGTLQGESEHREVVLLAPYGFSCLPPEGTKGVLLPLEQGWVCAGFPMRGADLQPGELLLRSAGGAFLRLKNNGEVEINGTVIPKKEEEI